MQAEKDQTHEYVCKEYLLFRIFDQCELEFMRTKIPKSVLGRKEWMGGCFLAESWQAGQENNLFIEMQFCGPN